MSAVHTASLAWIVSGDRDPHEPGDPPPAWAFWALAIAVPVGLFLAWCAR